MTNSKVIVLWGKGESGKTTTLNMLIDKLLPLSSKTIYKNKSTKPIENSCVVFEYNGKTIGIITAGDDAKSLERYFSQITVVCDIYVFASRTKGSSCSWILRRFSKSIIMWQEKWSITERNGAIASLNTLQNDANEKQSEALIDAIDALL